MTKKMAACERTAYEVLPRSSCGFIQFSTAAFEFFKKDMREYILGHPEYKIQSDVPSKDLNGVVTKETVKVVSVTAKAESLFTINLHSTTSTAMINGPKYTRFMDIDLPSLTARLENMSNTIDRAK